jgi:hypothetical protein
MVSRVRQGPWLKARLQELHLTHADFYKDQDVGPVLILKSEKDWRGDAALVHYDAKAADVRLMQEQMERLNNWIARFDISTCWPDRDPGAYHGTRPLGASARFSPMRGLAYAKLVPLSQRRRTAQRTRKQLMAIYGWETVKMAAEYRKKADQKRLAKDAMRLIHLDRDDENESGEKMSHFHHRWDNFCKNRNEISYLFSDGARRGIQFLE